MNSTMVTVIVGVIALVVGFLIGNMTADRVSEIVVMPTSTTQSAIEKNEADAKRKAEMEAAVIAGKNNEVAFTIEVVKLLESQRLTLKTVGITVDKLNITNAMVTCAEVELGAARVGEIKGGAEITMVEGVTLISCYSSNTN